MTDSTPCEIHDTFDPRRTRRLYSVGVPSFGRIFADMLRSLVSLGILVVLPCWYVLKMVRRRRWSLSQLLLAPPIVLVILITWNMRWLHEPGILENLLSGVAWMGGTSALVLAARQRRREDPFSGKAWIFLIVATLVFVSLHIYLLRNQTYFPGVRYVVDWRDVGLMLVSSVCMAGQLYWIGRFARTVVIWGLRRIARKAA